jgi:hypothetical protein
MRKLLYLSYAARRRHRGARIMSSSKHVSVTYKLQYETQSLKGCTEQTTNLVND